MPGSVIAMAVTSSPEAQPGSQRRFCSSLPKLWMYGTTMSECSDMREAPLVDARQLLDDDDRVEEVAARPAVALLQPRAQEAARARLAPRLAIDHACLAPARLVGDHLALDELAEGLAEELVVVVEQRAVHAVRSIRGPTARTDVCQIGAPWARGGVCKRQPLMSAAAGCGPSSRPVCDRLGWRRGGCSRDGTEDQHGEEGTKVRRGACSSAPRKTSSGSSPRWRAARARGDASEAAADARSATTATASRRRTSRSKAQRPSILTRNAQFDYINAKAERCIDRGHPVISVAIKKKEPAGNFKNARRPGAKVTAGEQAVVADLDEAVGQNVEEKAANEFLGGHDDLLAILGSKADAVFVERDESVVRDAHAMRVSAEILEDLLRSGEGTFCVHHPVLAVEGVLEVAEGLAIGEAGTGATQVEFAVVVGSSEPAQELAAEEVGQHADGEEILLAARDPAVAGGREAATSDDAVDMGMESEITSPRVKDGGHAQLGAQTLGVLPELEKSAGRGREEEVEDSLPVPTSEQPELMRQGEHDVEVVRGQDVLHALVDPLGLSQRLALRAVAISARVVGGPRERAPVAQVHVSAEDLGSADFDGTHGRPLLRAEGVRLSINLADGAEDVRHLEARPPFSPCGRSRPLRMHVPLPEDLAFLCPEQVERTLGSANVPETHLGVAGRRLDRSVSEQPLDGANVCARLQEMRGESVPKRMGCYTLAEAALDNDLMQDALDSSRRDRAARDYSWEQLGSIGATDPAVRPQNLEQSLAEHHVAVLRPLALMDMDEHPLAVDVGDLEGTGLRDAKPCPVRRHQDRFGQGMFGAAAIFR